MTITKTTNLPITDLVIAATAPLVSYDFGKLYRKLNSNNPNEVQLVGAFSSIEAPTKVTLSFKEIPNIYAGRGVSESNQASIKKGSRMFIKHSRTLIVDDDITGESTFLPEDISLTINSSRSGLYTASDLIAALDHLRAFLRDKNAADVVDEWQRGAIVPAEV